MSETPPLTPRGELTQLVVVVGDGVTNPNKTSPRARDDMSPARSPARSMAPMIEKGDGPNVSPPKKKNNKQTASPAKPSDKQQTSPAKPADKHTSGIDVSSSSLAAISARLMPYVTPAELEIARINREIAASNRLKQNTHAARNDHQERHASDEQATSNDGDDEQDADHVASNSRSSPSPKGHASAAPACALTAAIKGVIGGGGGNSALHDSMMAEEWVNVHLEPSSAFLLPASDIQALLQRVDVRGGSLAEDAVEEQEESFAFRRKGDHGGPLGRAGIDRWTLYRLGMPKDLVDRLYRALYVYTNGFHNIINEIASHCPPSVEKHVSSNVWLAFLLLLEQCENGKYEMAMLKFKQATQEWRKQMQEEFLNDKICMDAHAQEIETQLHEERTHSRDKSERIATLEADACITTTCIADLQHTVTDQAEQLRLLKLEILVHEDTEKNLSEQIDDARKDYEVANSERFTALTERFSLEEEIRKLQHESERLESEKSNYAKRMHETLFMNQALRATNESLKQHAVVASVEKDKLEKDKQALQSHVEKLESDLRDIKLLKASVEHDLVESARRESHLEERSRAMKNQLDAEMENTTKYIKEISQLSRLLDEEKVHVGVLDAKCNLLTAEKQNTGMRAQDKLRIERLLNQKLELENQLETMKLERTKDHEQIWNLRASLEALDSELQQTKRVFSAGQQAFLHSERSAEQLRHQLQDVEKNYEKASKNLTSLRERFKMFEESSKDQVTKVEVELKVTSAQLREVTYVNRDNASVIADLTKTLEIAEKEAKALKTRVDVSEKQYESLLNEKEHLQRDQKERDVQSSSSKQTISKFLRELQAMLALVKVDEYPLDEALRELLRMVMETFGENLDISKVLDDEDEPLDFEEEYDEDELAQEENDRQNRLGIRRTGFSMGSVGGTSGGGASNGDAGESNRVDGSSRSLRLSAGAFANGSGSGSGFDGENGELDADGKRRLTKVSRMSKFRRSKLDSQVKKLQRELENSGDMVRSLEGVVCTQADEIAQLTGRTEQQTKRLLLNENQKGMLLSEIDALSLVLGDARQLEKKTKVALQEAKIELVMESNKIFQMQVLLQALRRQYDSQCAASEDLMSKIGRAYEHDLYMKSLRRDEACQATVAMSEQFTQTLVPQRNPVLERARVPAMNLPAMNATSRHTESILSQINEATKSLLPHTTNHVTAMELHLGMGGLSASPSLVSKSRSALPPFTPQNQQYAVRPRMQSPRQQHQHHDHGHRHMHRRMQTAAEQNSPQHTMATTMSGGAAPPPQLVRHYNEFGMRQDVLISPVYPPYFPSNAIPTTAKKNGLKKQRPRPQVAARPRIELDGSQRDQVFDEQTDSAAGWTPRVHQPARFDPTASGASRGGVQSHRGFLRTGLEVLRGGTGGNYENDDASSADDQNGHYFGHEDDPSHDGEDDYDPQYDEHDQANGREWSGGSRASLHSPSKLELAVRDFHDEQDATYAKEGRSPSPQSRYYAHRLKQAESRASMGVNEDGDSEDDDDAEYDDGDGVERRRRGQQHDSPFVPAVLYPLLPPG